jgi:acyl carrier protein
LYVFNALTQPHRFDLELVRVPTARYPNLFVTHIRLQTSSDYKLLMYVDMRQVTQLRAIAGVVEAVVVVRADALGDKRLVAYVTCNSAAPNMAHVRDRLKEFLPPYMLPHAFVPLHALPLTSNGKLDRKSLPPPELEHYSTRKYAEPSGGVEERVAAIWRELLNVEKIGRDDNFFDLGGHSLIILLACSRIRSVFEVSLPLSELFAAPTIRSLAAKINDVVLEMSAISRVPAVSPSTSALTDGGRVN